MKNRSPHDGAVSPHLELMDRLQSKIADDIFDLVEMTLWEPIVNRADRIRNPIMAHFREKFPH